MDDTKALAALGAYHRLTLSPDKRPGGPTPLRWWTALGVALIPVLLVAVTALLAVEPGPAPAPPATAPAVAEALAGAEAALAAARTAEAATEAPPAKSAAPPAPGSAAALKVAKERLDSAEALAAMLAERGAAPAKAGHAAYRAQVLFYAGLAILLALATAVQKAQVGIVNRHASTFWPRRALTGKRSRGLDLRSDLALGCGIAIGLVGLVLAPLALP